MTVVPPPFPPPNSPVMVRLSGRLEPCATLSWRATRVCGFIPGAAFHRYIFTAVPRAALPPMPRGYSARTLEADECGQLDLGAPPDAVAYRLGQGCSVLAAFNRKQQLVGAFWLTDRPFREDEIDLWYDAQGTGAWDLGLYVPPEHRATRAFAALWAGAGEWLDERGLGWSFSRITDYNAASLSAHARLQGWHLGTAWGLRMGKWQLTGSSFLRRPCWHKVGENAPVIRLTPPEGM